LIHLNAPARRARHGAATLALAGASAPAERSAMLKLAVLMFILVAPTFAGTLVIGVLAANMALYSATPIVLAAALGVVAAAPASWFIARAILRTTGRNHAHG
jgi:hypothetical protein